VKVRKEKGLIEDKDEFSLMVGNEKTLADRLGTSPDDIEKKLNAKRKGVYVIVSAFKNLCFCLLLISMKMLYHIESGCAHLYWGSPKFRICTRARHHDLGYCCVIGSFQSTLG